MAFCQTNKVARSFLLNEPPAYKDLQKLLQKIPENFFFFIEKEASRFVKQHSIPEEISLEAECFLYLQISKCFAEFRFWNDNKSLAIDAIEKTLEDLLYFLE